MQATNSFSVVTTCNGSVSTPSLSFLRQFDVALVWGSGTSYSIAGSIGDILSQYWESGGSVVLMHDAICDGKLTGRFASASDGYILMDGSAKTDLSDRLGPIYEQDSPLLSDVTTFSASPAPKCAGAVMNKGVPVAAWKSGTPLIVRGARMGRPLVLLNMHPVSASAGSGWFGNGSEIMRNALLYSACAPCGAKYSSTGEPEQPRL
jgi:hypothetical protein